MKKKKKVCETCDRKTTQGKDGFWVCPICREERGFNDKKTN